MDCKHIKKDHYYSIDKVKMELSCGLSSFSTLNLDHCFEGCHYHIMLSIVSYHCEYSIVVTKTFKIAITETR
jgi:hypothetical protein